MRRSLIVSKYTSTLFHVGGLTFPFLPDRRRELPTRAVIKEDGMTDTSN
jgi:hypothetical protein